MSAAPAAGDKPRATDRWRKQALDAATAASRSKELRSAWASATSEAQARGPAACARGGAARLSPR